MIPKCSNLVYGMTFGYAESGMVLGCVMLVGLSRTAVSATSALLFLLTAIIPLVYCILFLSEINLI